MQSFATDACSGFLRLPNKDSRPLIAFDDTGIVFVGTLCVCVCEVVYVCACVCVCVWVGGCVCGCIGVFVYSYVCMYA